MKDFAVSIQGFHKTSDRSMEKNKEYDLPPERKAKYILKFKELYRKKEGKDITDQEALEHFEKLTVLVSAIYQPIPKSFFADGLCPACQNNINIDDFTDPLTEKEFLISGLCQKCQNNTFK